MKILVAVASRHGATTEIGNEIAKVLGDAGLYVTVERPAAVSDLAAYEAAVIGSAVYVGRWMEEARDFVTRHGAALQQRPVWLFSSGPIGDPPKPEGDPVDVAEMKELSGAREHRLFSGRIDRGQLGIGERAIVSLVRAPEGDYRTWDEVRSWALSIAEQLADVAAAGPGRR